MQFEEPSRFAQKVRRTSAEVDQIRDKVPGKEWAKAARYAAVDANTGHIVDSDKDFVALEMRTGHKSAVVTMANPKRSDRALG